MRNITRFISKVFLGGLTWPQRIVAFTVFSVIIASVDLLLKYLHAGRVTSDVVGVAAVVTASWVARYATGRARIAALELLGVYSVGLVIGGLCGYAVARAYHLGSSAAVMSIDGGAIVGMIICVVTYALLDLLRAYRDDSGRFSKRMISMARPPIVDRSPATSRPINER